LDWWKNQELEINQNNPYVPSIKKKLEKQGNYMLVLEIFVVLLLTASPKVEYPAGKNSM
jgi:hypothetical protein